MIKKILSQNWLIIFITIIMAYILGCIIVNTVDRRLGEISINMPKVNLPNIVVNLDRQNLANVKATMIDEGYNPIEKFDTGTSSDNKQGTTQETTKEPKQETPFECNNNKNSNFFNLVIPVQKEPKEKPAEMYVQLTPDEVKKLNAGSDTTPSNDVRYVVTPVNLVRYDQIPSQAIDLPTLADNYPYHFGDEEAVQKTSADIRKCRESVEETAKKKEKYDVRFMNKKRVPFNEQCMVKSNQYSMCHYGPTNYKDPLDMTDKERKQYMKKYRKNMTLQDYINWLLLFRDNPYCLNEVHFKNLKTVVRGGKLTLDDMPLVRLPAPTNASSYFSKMYSNGLIKIDYPDDSETGPMIPANYTKYTEFIPPEYIDKAWVTLNDVDLYKPDKVDAQALNYYIRPLATTGEENQMYINDRQQLYHSGVFNREVPKTNL